MENYFLKTERTKIRPLNPDDAENFYNLNLDPEVLKYTGDVPFKTPEAARYFLVQYDQYKKYGVGRMAIIEKENDEFIGWCGLKYSADSDEYDIGFRFFRKYWNKGYATETSRAFIYHGFNTLRIKEIIGRAMKDNAASVRVLQKIGMDFSNEFDFEGQPGVIYKLKQNSKKVK